MSSPQSGEFPERPDANMDALFCLQSKIMHPF